MSGNNSLNRSLFTYAQCKTIDNETIAAGLPARQLMGQAAIAMLLAMQQNGHLSEKKRLLVLAGQGNNGGDGLALLYMLAGMMGLSWTRKNTMAYSTGEPKTPEANFYFEKLQACQIPLQSAADFLNLRCLVQDSIVIEALLGAGQRWPIMGQSRHLLQHLKQLKDESPRSLLLSIDVPAGLSETHQCDFQKELLPLPDHIYVCGPPKLAQAWHEELRQIPETLLPLGFYPPALEHPAFELLQAPQPVLKAAFSRRSSDHKYTAGSAGILGGSKGMEGALLLCLDSCLAAGCGIARVALPGANSIGQEFLLRHEPSALTASIAGMAQAPLKALIIGPGLAPADLAFEEGALLSLLQEQSTTLQGIVLDAAATALILSEKYPDVLRKKTVLTPHGGEYARLGRRAPETVQDILATMELNDAVSQSWCVLKGSRSLLLGPQGCGRPALLNADAPGLAIGGSGDCLAGILGAALARVSDRSLRERLETGLLLHNLAGKQNANQPASLLPRRITQILNEISL